MKVICDNCGAMYKIPDEKLVKPVNKATCRQCSHRMLIPRPRRGADPDERTLVTAVPPTPAAAPMRAADSGPPTTPIHEVEELTAPTGGRRTEETRWVRNELSGPSVAVGGVAQVSARPAGNSATERIPAHAGPATPPAPVMPQRSSQAPSSDPRAHTRESLRRAASLADDAATQVGPDPTLTIPPRDEPTPLPAARTTPAAPVHDPRGDMGLALFGVAVALVGVAVLGFSSVIDAAGNYWLVLGASALGMLLAVGGGVGAFLVLLTSGRGRKPAWRVASILLAGLAALLVAGVPALGRVGFDAFTNGVDTLNGNIAGLFESVDTPNDDGTVDAPPALADVPITDPGADDPPMDTDAGGDADTNAGDEIEPPIDDGGTADPIETAAVTPPTTRRAAPTTRTTTRTPATTRRTTAATTRTGGTTGNTNRGGTAALTDAQELELPDDPLAGGSAVSKPPASDLPSSPPLKAIDVMVKSNVGVKKCFFDYQRAEGSLPKRVDVRFTIKPSGDATRINTTQGKLQGTDLESCLIRAIRSINFPPSQEGTTLTFPFVFG